MSKILHRMNLSSHKQSLFNSYQNGYNMKSKPSKNAFGLSYSLIINTSKDNCSYQQYLQDKLKVSNYDSPNKISSNKHYHNNSISNLLSYDLLSSPLMSKELKHKFSKVFVDALSYSNDDYLDQYNQLYNHPLSTPKKIQVKKNEIMKLLCKDKYNSISNRRSINETFNQSKLLKVNKLNGTKSFLEPERISVKTNRVSIQELKCNNTSGYDSQNNYSNNYKNSQVNYGNNADGINDNSNIRISFRKAQSNLKEYPDKGYISQTPSNKYLSAKKTLSFSSQSNYEANGKSVGNNSNTKVRNIDFSSFPINNIGNINSNRIKEKPMEIKVNVKDDNNEIFTFRKIDTENESNCNTENGSSQN